MACDFDSYRRGLGVLTCLWVVALCCPLATYGQQLAFSIDATTVPSDHSSSTLRPALSLPFGSLLEPAADSIRPVYHFELTDELTDELSGISTAGYEQETGSESGQWNPTTLPIYADEEFPASHRLIRSNASSSHRGGSDWGIGHERVMFAPMVVSPAIAANELGFRFHFDQGLNVPDRAEFFWATNPIGPGGDPSVDVIDTHVRMVVGSPKLTGITQYTLRSLDPRNAANTTGMGDMMVGVQSLLLDGKRLKVSTLVQTHLATGSTQRGLGVGHTSLQPGVLWRYCASPSLFWFGEISYLVPVGGDRKIDGNVLTTGLAVSTIAWESDRFAVLPTLEMRTLSFTSGGQTGPAGDFQNVDGETAFELFPGMRFVLGPQSDWGLCEIGVSAGTVFADDDWFDSRIRLNIRFTR